MSGERRSQNPERDGGEASGGSAVTSSQGANQAEGQSAVTQMGLHADGPSLLRVLTTLPLSAGLFRQKKKEKLMVFCTVWRLNHWLCVFPLFLHVTPSLSVPAGGCPSLVLYACDGRCCFAAAARKRL